MDSGSACGGNDLCFFVRQIDNVGVIARNAQNEGVAEAINLVGDTDVWQGSDLADRHMLRPRNDS